MEASLLDRLIGLEPAIASLLEIAQRLQTDPDPGLRVLAATMHRHARGEQVSIAAVKQALALRR